MKNPEDRLSTFRATDTYLKSQSTTSGVRNIRNEVIQEEEFKE